MRPKVKWADLEYGILALTHLIKQGMRTDDIDHLNYEVVGKKYSTRTLNQRYKYHTGKCTVCNYQNQIHLCKKQKIHINIYK